MNRAPAFQFYPDKWLAHTRHLSDMACRVYHDLLCWIWQHSPDQHTIHKDGVYVAIARPKDEVDRAMAEVQQPAFPLLKLRGEKYVSEGLRKEIEKQRVWRQKSASGGRHSASARKGKHLDANHPSTTLQPPLVPNGNTPSPSSSPSPSHKDQIERESARAEVPQDTSGQVRYIQTARNDWSLSAVDVENELKAMPTGPARAEVVRQFCADAFNGDRPRNPIGMLRGYIGKANAPSPAPRMGGRPPEKPTMGRWADPHADVIPGLTDYRGGKA